MKRTKKEFEEFKDRFNYWKYVFGLDGYQIYFTFNKVEGEFAGIERSLTENTVAVNFSSEIPDSSKEYIDIENSAKHEAIHLLLHDLARWGHIRFNVSKDEMILSEEKLVIKLIDLIK